MYCIGICVLYMHVYICVYVYIYIYIHMYAQAPDAALQHRRQRLRAAPAGLRDADHRRRHGGRQHLGHPVLQAEAEKGEHVPARLHADRHDVPKWPGLDLGHALLPLLPYDL